MTARPENRADVHLPKLLAHHEVQAQEEKDDEAYEVIHVLASWVHDHLSHLVEGVCEHFRRFTKTATHAIQQAILRLDLGVNVQAE
jgi:hypothetical protein